MTFAVSVQTLQMKESIDESMRTPDHGPLTLTTIAKCIGFFVDVLIN